jgi:acyl-CoA reductase-like NAD-dependent aldehyde dehydrogenase
MDTATSNEPAERGDDTSAPVETLAFSPSPSSRALPESSPFSTRSPLDDTPLSVVEPTDPATIQGLVDRARVAQLAWAETSVRDRALAVGQIKQRILQRAEEIAELVHRECGKPIEEAALAEVLPNADLVDYWTGAIEELLDGTTIELDALSYPGKTGRIHRDARGTLAVITPWNYPVAIPLRTLIPALLAGNAVLFKPSEVTPRAGALVASLFAGLLPEGVLTLVQGGGDVGSALVAAEGLDLVVFTGSVATGRRIAVACAERLIPCSLELGGKDAAIALADCEIERTANGIVWGAFTNAGQNCAAVERVYIEKSVADRLIPKIVAAAKALRPGVDTAMITTQKQCAIVRRHLADAVAAGGEILVGGAPEEGSLAFLPTVIKLASEDTALMREETFGPILPIVLVDGEDDAIARTNASKFGLTTSLWTRRYNHAHTLAKKLRSGVVTINNHGFTAAIPSAPWTGAGDSGYGITNSAHALGELTRVRFVLEDRNGAKRELWWYPYTPVLRTIAFAMAKVRGGAGFFGRIKAIFQLVRALPKRLMGG